ncbi:MAG: PDZ domain-containing protein [Candidatus Eisenbacteria bacterium]|uniref:PDZ domain-containing protein n=1 Tax=Eiseniibacteriota bacterium TaxID=2212470 RepID=A0A956LVI1_UNCEI|nr:PDZ domain-containing protein [Candidatus Eisenbacteria bacterium]
MMRMRWILALLAVAAVSAPVLAGEGEKCTANTQECLDYMATRMKNTGWVGIEVNVEEGSPMEVMKVVPDSPAEAAGMKPGDILVAINGLEINQENQEALQKARAESKPGQSVTYTIGRSGEHHDLTLTLGAMPADVLARYIGEHMLQHASTAMSEEKAEANPGS